MNPATLGCAALLLLCAIEPALAQAKNPFSVGISEGGGSPTGITGWLLAQQGWFEHQLSAAVRTAKTDGSALWSLVGLSLVYGVFHAAGPGHGKAVLASYMVANERALRRGIGLSVLAALLQGLVAIILVGILAAVLHATAQRMRDAASLVEIASFAGIACLGAWLVWRKGGTFLRLWRRLPPRVEVGKPGRPGSVLAFPNGAERLAFSASAAQPRSFVCDDGSLDHAADCAHCLALDPAVLNAPRFSWRDAGLTVLAAGSRPCSGAILVLVFALTQGMFAAGVLSVLAMALGVAVTTAALASLAVLAKGTARALLRPGSRRAALAMVGLEALAALLVLGAGVSLLLGSTLAGGA